MDYLNIALAKGRLADKSVKFFKAIGFDCPASENSTRKLIFTDEKNKARFFMVKPGDVPTYVEYGAADIGIVGKDTLLEEGRNLYEVLDLGFSACSIVVAGPKALEGKLDTLTDKRVGTKYPNIAREYFEHKRMESIEVIKLNGSVELAPLVGLSEVIVDLVESGRTLKENGLIILDHIADVSARLIVNRVSMKIKSEMVNRIVEGFRNQLKGEGK
jgi:ATP phosphoribosyltransferase